MMVTMAITQVEPNNNLDSNSPLLTKIKIEEGEYGEGVPEVSSSCHCLTQLLSRRSTCTSRRWGKGRRASRRTGVQTKVQVLYKRKILNKY